MSNARILALAVFLTLGLGLSMNATADQQSAELVVQTKIPKPGSSIAYGFNALWTMSNGRLLKVNPADNSSLEIEIPTSKDAGSLSDLDKYRGIAVGEGAVWIPEMASSTIHKVDPQSNQVVLTIPTDLFGGAGSIGVGEGAVWVITFDDHNKTLTRYNAASSEIEARIKLPRPGVGVIVGDGSVWVTAASVGELYRIDPKTNQVAATIAIHGASHLLAAAADSIWVAFDKEGLVQRIDAASGEVVTTIETGATDMESDGDIAAGGGFIWTITRGSIVSKIDPTANSAKGAFAPPPGTIMGRRLRYGAGSLWVSGASIFRLSPP